MSVKSAVFAAATVAVLCLAVYLFIQVRSSPAQAHVTATNVTPPRSSSQPIAATAPDPTPRPAAPNAPPPRVGPPEREPRPGTEASGMTPAPTAVDESKINIKLDSMMELANKAYDQQDFDQAIAIASKVLTKDPDNVRMLRIIVSAHCIQGDSVVAQQHYSRLPQFDREQMRTRCDRYGVSFKEPGQ